MFYIVKRAIIIYTFEKMSTLIKLFNQKADTDEKILKQVSERLRITYYFLHFC